MYEQISATVKQHHQERNRLIAEANERLQKQQQALDEHNTRMTEIQVRVAQLEGAIYALQSLIEPADAGNAPGEGEVTAEAA